MAIKPEYEDRKRELLNELMYAACYCFKPAYTLPGITIESIDDYARSLPADDIVRAEYLRIRGIKA